MNKELMTSCVKDLMDVLKSYKKLNLSDKDEILSVLENFISNVLISFSIKSDGAIDSNAYLVLDEFIDAMNKNVTTYLKSIEEKSK